MKSGLNFLLAARRCEIAELEQLAQTGELVGAIGRFIHALQRERGLSNVFLGSHGQRFAAQRAQQAAECARIEQAVRAIFDRLDTEAGSLRNGARLFSRIATVLHGLDGLPLLRERVAGQAVGPADATRAFVQLIGGLLAVVFEAADSATDPQVSRALVAMFNFMQGKEFAGQERAFGAGVFAAGGTGSGAQQQWQHLIESQDACFRLFRDFADPAVLGVELASQEPQTLAELERLRRIGCAPLPAGGLDASLSQAWYDCCTRRIDAMRAVEDALASHLQRLCAARIAQARAELHDQQVIHAALAGPAPLPSPAHYGPHLERSVLGMLQEQAQRMQAMSDELDAVRATLNERRVIERAKGLLMAHRHLGEDEAYKAMRQMAMSQNRRVLDVAEAVLAMADMLPGKAQ